MGIEIRNPIIAGASSLTSNMDSIEKLESAGAGAIVIKSLFEEEIELERFKLDEDRQKYDERHAEMISIFPQTEHAGPKEHLMWVKKAKQNVSIPVIASLNAINRATWIEYAERLQETGVDGLELNLYHSPEDIQKMGSAVEVEQISILQMIRDKISIPVSVKISPFYSNVLHFMTLMDQIGVNGYVLFNRFFQPDIDVQKEKHLSVFHLSRKEDMGLSLKYVGLLSGYLTGDLCGSTGIFEGQDIIKMILAGASAVQVVSTLYQNQIDHIVRMLNDIRAWMDRKGYLSIQDFKGKLSKKNSKDRWAYSRAQYVKLLLNPQEFLENYPLL
jgi:dihydroorotate dehydrogenase (fumarate)